MTSSPPVRPLLAASVVAFVALAAHRAEAQAPLVLDTVGGSTPGTLALDLRPGNYPNEAAIILFGFDSGPTPIAMFDPADPRSVRVGTSALSNSIFGLLGMDGHFRVGPLPVPSLPGLVDAPFFFQGVTLFGPGTLVDRISNPTAVRLGLAGTFRDRFVSMVDERAFAVVLPRADGRWLVAGGGRGGLLSQVAHRTAEIYDDVDDAFVLGPPMTVERSLHTATRLPDGRWLIAGGVNYVNDPQALCELYDPVADTFTACAPMLVPRMGHTATLLGNGRVLVTGGLQAMTVMPLPNWAIRDATNTTELYDPVANTWTAGPNLRAPRAAHVAILRPDGRVLLAGGIGWDPFLIPSWQPVTRSTCDLYDPAANTIAAGPSMAAQRAMTEAIQVGPTRWLVAGGLSAMSWANAAGTLVASAEVYDSTANAWSSAGSMATSRGNHRVWALGGGRFLHAGGASGDLLAPTALASTEVWDAATNGWTPGPSLTIPRAGAAQLLTPRGQVQLFGGETAGGGISRGVEFFYF